MRLSSLGVWVSGFEVQVRMLSSWALLSSHGCMRGCAMCCMCEDVRSAACEEAWCKHTPRPPSVFVLPAQPSSLPLANLCKLLAPLVLSPHPFRAAAEKDVGGCR